MEALKVIIRNIAFILLLATFLEMLLPNEKMRGLVRLVMGLFVVAALIEPLMSFFRIDFTNQVPAWITSAKTEMQVLAPDTNEQAAGGSAVREQYKKILQNQIKILVEAVDGVERAEVQVELGKGGDGFAEYPPIAGISVFFSQKAGAVLPVEPVIIGGDGESGETEKYTAKETLIQKQIAAFMQISEEIITVREQ